MVEQETELKLITKADFDVLKGKYKHIEPAAQKIIDQATDPLDVLALVVQEGSGFTIFKARVLNEASEDNLLQIFKEGIF